MSADGISTRDVMLRMTNGFQVSQAIHVAAEMGVADLLRDGPKGAEDLAEEAGADATALYRLLRALSGVGVFVEGEDGRFGLTPLAEHLRSDVPGSMRGWALQIGQPYFWRSWGHLLHGVRCGEPAFPDLYGTTAWEYRTSHPREQEIFDASMTSLSAPVAEAVARSYDFSGMDVVVDVGGGEGVLLAAILAANPGSRGILFDQPHVVAEEKTLLQRAGVADRCESVGGNFFDAVPQGADAYLLKSVIHDWDDAAATEILRVCRAAMTGTAKLLVVEPVIRAKNEPEPAKFSDLNMLVMLGGRERTAADFERLYAAAGFRLTEAIPTGSPHAIIEGVPV